MNAPTLGSPSTINLPVSANAPILMHVLMRWEVGLTILRVDASVNRSTLAVGTGSLAGKLVDANARKNAVRKIWKWIRQLVSVSRLDQEDVLLRVVGMGSIGIKDCVNAHLFVEQQVQIVVEIKCGIQILANVSVHWMVKIVHKFRCGILKLVCVSVHQMVKIVAKIK